MVSFGRILPLGKPTLTDKLYGDYLIAPRKCTYDHFAVVLPPLRLRQKFSGYLNR
jgi:hypothetical protein